MRRKIGGNSGLMAELVITAIPAYSAELVGMECVRPPGANGRWSMVLGVSTRQRLRERTIDCSSLRSDSPITNAVFGRPIPSTSARR